MIYKTLFMYIIIMPTDIHQLWAWNDVRRAFWI